MNRLTYSRDLLYDLAGQMVQHLLSYLSEEKPQRVDRDRRLIARKFTPDDGPLLKSDRVRGASQSLLHRTKAVQNNTATAAKRLTIPDT
jgi:hypothetical protein